MPAAWHMPSRKGTRRLSGAHVDSQVAVTCSPGCHGSSREASTDWALDTRLW